MYNNVIVFLIGLPGIGKLTVARALADKHPEFKLVDVHSFTNVVLTLNRDFHHPRNQYYRRKIKQLVLDMMSDLCPINESFILTNALTKQSAIVYEENLDMANRRSAAFVPVVLTSDADVIKQRITSSEREKNHKTTSVDELNRWISMGTHEFDHPNRLDIDNTNLSPDAVADIITKHLDNILSSEYKRVC